MSTEITQTPSTGSPARQRFTPGPWQALKGLREMQIWTQLPYAAGDGSGMGDFVADISVEDLSDEEVERVRADAALMAAAPELLAALQDAVASPGTGAWRKKAMAAITKAFSCE